MQIQNVINEFISSQEEGAVFQNLPAWKKEIKIIVVGDGKVGKTSLALRFCKKKFSSSYKKTIGVDFLSTTKFIKYINTKVTFQIWDTAGQEEYDSLTRRYYKGAECALIVSSITDRNSFLNIPHWKEKIESECGAIPILAVMSKLDITDESQIKVTQNEVIEYCRNLNLEVFFTSSKNDIRINEAFEHLAKISFKSKIQKEQHQLPTEDFKENIHLYSNSEPMVAPKTKNFKLKLRKSEGEKETNSSKEKRKKKCC